LEQPTRLGDEGITRFLISHLDAELDAVAVAEDTLSERTRNAIARSLSEGVPKLEQIARSLGLSARSLHRRLADEGLSYQSLTDDTRRDLAEGMLAEDQHSLSEIAFLTGFSEQSAFTRAFKRWTGVTPAQYRKSNF
jgi:AraC-like DNA-binding protein